MSPRAKKADPRLRIVQRRSGIGAQDGQRRTLRALGLRRVGQSVTQPDRPEIRGMLSKVAHLVDVAPAGEAAAEEKESA